MKVKHLKYWLEQCLRLSQLSECKRNKFGCLIIDPSSNCLLVDGYNGNCRGGSKMCGGENECLRDIQGIKSGTVPSIGCNHAEANAICNSSRIGIGIKDKWLIVNGEPCLMCSKLIHATGLSVVIYIDGGYSTKEGIDYLKKNRVTVLQVNQDLSNLQEVLRSLIKVPKISSEMTVQVSPFS